MMEELTSVVCNRDTIFSKWGNWKKDTNGGRMHNISFTSSSNQDYLFFYASFSEHNKLTFAFFD